MKIMNERKKDKKRKKERSKKRKERKKERKNHKRCKGSLAKSLALAAFFFFFCFARFLPFPRSDYQRRVLYSFLRNWAVALASILPPETCGRPSRTASAQGLACMVFLYNVRLSSCNGCQPRRTQSLAKPPKQPPECSR